MNVGKWLLGACNFKKSEKVKNVRIAKKVSEK